MVTVLFWSLLYDYKEAPSYSNLFVHLLQSVVVLIDQWVVVSDIQDSLASLLLFFLSYTKTHPHTGLWRGGNGDLSQLGPLSQFPWSAAKLLLERVFQSLFLSPSFFAGLADILPDLLVCGGHQQWRGQLHLPCSQVLWHTIDNSCNFPIMSPLCH